jgi:ubiquinone/menaquinone biosynthesis C-methylase UbiE
MNPTKQETIAATLTTQRAGFENRYDKLASSILNSGRSTNSVTRFLFDRRLAIAVRRLMKLTASRPEHWNALVVCAGGGNEGTFLINAGFGEVTISDFSEAGLRLGAGLDARLKTRLLDAEKMDLPDSSYDLVLVQDGLHHLSRPPVGLTEMLRVARRGVIVIEPHAGVVSRLWGATWERTDSAVNYVFRWNKWLFCSVVQSYLLLGSKTAEAVARAPVDSVRPYRLNYNRKEGYPYQMDVIRLWDHHGMMNKLAHVLGNHGLALMAVRAAYACCAGLLPGLGNMLIGIVVKETE